MLASQIANRSLHNPEVFEYRTGFAPLGIDGSTLLPPLVGQQESFRRSVFPFQSYWSIPTGCC